MLEIHPLDMAFSHEKFSRTALPGWAAGPAAAADLKLLLRQPKLLSEMRPELLGSVVSIAMGVPQKIDGLYWEIPRTNG